MGGVSNFDRMEVQIKTLQQEALATQRTLQQLQSREAPGPFSSMPPMDLALLGTMALFFGLMLADKRYFWNYNMTAPYFYFNPSITSNWIVPFI